MPPNRTMVARVSLEDVVIYANEALATYLSSPKKELVGSSLKDVARLCRGEIASCFARPETGRNSNRLVSDGDGKVFEAQLHCDGGVLDIVLDEISSPEALGSDLRESIGMPLDSLSEEELRTVRQPDRRYLTVTSMRLQGLTQFAERFAPMEVKLMMDSFVEEACEAVRETRGTVGDTSRDAVLGIFGAPRYYADHPLRAILAACDQLQRTSQLHAGLYREGKELPSCSCGIWTGDALVGMLGGSIGRRYSAVGAPVDLAERLCGLALPGETVLPEHTLTHLLRTLPEGWEHVRAESEHEPDLSQIDWTPEEIAPVPEHLKKVVYLVGRGVRDSADRTELFFDYRWTFRVPGREPTPILRVVRPAAIGDSFELREDNVVTAQLVQAFGKYKLTGVISTGGMGTVWRGVDRFGNVLAIKILHASQSMTETQLKRFRREAEIMARLPHRNICRVYEMSEFDGIQYLAMEYVDGLPLSDLLYEDDDLSNEPAKRTAREVDLRELIRSLRSRSGPAEVTVGTETERHPRPGRILPIEQTLSLIIKVCEAIQFAHEHGVLHRDLKPGNILLREDGEPLVADFGLAKLKSGEMSHSLSLPGHVVGTLENMAPEQAESSKDVDERADVYGIGTILYQMLTGRRHFEATGNIVKDAQTLRTHEPVRPRVYNPQIHPDLEIITLKALRNALAERYRSVAALRADIDHYRRGEVISAKGISPVEPLKKLVLRNKVVSAVAGASLLILAIGGLISIYFLDANLKEANTRYLLVEEKLQAASKREQEARREALAAQSETARTEQILAETRHALDVSRRTFEEGRRAENEVPTDDQFGGEAQQPVTPPPALAPEPTLPPERVVEHVIAPEEAKPPWQPMLEASRIFDVDLAQDELRRLEKTPQEVVNRLVRAMDEVSLALSERPGSGDAWMLKGRLHLALMEFGLAADSFREAAKAEEAPGDSNAPEELLDLVTRTAWPENFAKAAETLRASSVEENRIAGNVLRLVQSKRRLHNSSPDSVGPLRRRMTGYEAALAVIRRNDPGTHAFVESAGNGRVRVIFWNTPALKDLSPLLETELSGLAVVGARSLDWKTIFSLPVEELELSQCVLEGLPQRSHGFLRVRTLKLAESEVTTVDFVRNMPLLETLDLSSTRVTDLSPLLACRSLRHLNLTGLNPANLRAVMNLPLETLTLSPMLIKDRKALDALRFHRTLKVLRSPEDPPDQPATAFWRKLDDGSYDQFP